MGKVIYPRKGEVHTAPVTFAANFADNTWEQIIEACETNTVPDTWEIGDQKTMTINGTDYLIDIIGKNHDEYYVIGGGGAKAPLTFQLHDYYGTTYAMNSSYTNSWTDSAMYTTHLPAILAQMPSEVQAGIKAVNKATSAGNKSSVILYSTNKLFLLSEIEVFGTTQYSYAGEGSQYAYYAAGNSKVKTQNGNAALGWWLRSPYVDAYYCCVSTAGSTGWGLANNINGVAPAFCF